MQESLGKVANMSRIRASFKCQEDYKKLFNQSQCLLTISVGQATHEGEMFAAMISLINDNFNSCVLLVDDSLQRHTMAINTKMSAEYYYQISIEEGDLWLERHKKYLDRLTIPLKIFRWDKWLFHSKFDVTRNTIINAINSDPAYREAFESSISKFLTKYSERLTNSQHFDLAKARQLSLDFVVEECAALCLWQELDCQFEIYPNRHNAAIEETRRRFVLSSSPELLRPVAVCFKNAGQIKPQHFELLASVG